MKHLVLMLVVCFCLPRVAAAQTPWMFDFDINLTQDQAYVTQHLNTLQAGLPGAPAEGIVELVSKQTKLYFYQDAIDWLVRARDSGPQTDPEVVRVPQRCGEHFSFVKPSLLLDSPPPLCDLHEQAAMAAFDAAKLRTCAHVEFPETYIYDRAPLAWILPPDTGNIDVLIATLGGAMIQMIYPTGLVPADFLTQARPIIAKVRYETLKAELAARRQEYQDALGGLQNNGFCFKPAELAAFSAKVGVLSAELDAVEQELDGIYTAGLAQAVADRKAVEAQGRVRADLPYPALTDRDRELLAFFLGGLSWRVRGGGLIADDRLPLGFSMTFVPGPFQLIADIAGGVEGKDLGLPIYMNGSKGYKDWFDMGNWPPTNDKYSDLVEMTIRGKHATSSSAPVLEGRGFDVRHLVAGGLMMGPCYYYLWEELPGFVLGPPCEGWYPENLPGCMGGDYRHFCDQPISTGEFCVGGNLALGLVKSLLGGKPGTACTPDCFNKLCGADDTCGGFCTVCTDSGVTIPADSAVSASDGGASAADGAAQSTPEAGGASSLDAGVGQQPAPAEGCSVAHGPGHMLTTLLLALLLGLVVCGRRRARSQGRAPVC